jgi:hypothetical protein
LLSLKQGKEYRCGKNTQTLDRIEPLSANQKKVAISVEIRLKPDERGQ